MSAAHTYTMPKVSRVYPLPRCSVALYQTGDNNTLGQGVWSAKQVDNLRVAERYDVVTRRTTGVPYPQRHHTSESHEIIFDAIWNVEAVMGRNVEYMLVITWLDASFGSTRAYVRRFYAGVMTDSRDVASRDANEFGSSHTLSASWMNEVRGDGAPDEVSDGDAIC